MHRYEEIIIAGDFNIHWNNSDDLDASSLLEIAELYGLQQHVNDPTHVSGNVLDLIFTKLGSTIQLSVPDCSFFVSDHCFVSTRVSLARPLVVRKKVQIRKLKSIDSVSFENSLKESVKRILSTSKVEDAVSVYHLTLQEALDSHAPIKEKFITLRETVPWFTKDLIKMKSQLRNLEKTAKELRSNIFWEEYKHVRDCYVLYKQSKM